MSNKVTALVGSMLLVVAFLAGTTQGCGSSSGSDSPIDLCNRGCDKYVMCNPEDQAFLAQCKSLCSSSAPGSGQTCTNQTAIVNAAKACLNASCADFDGCQESIPECQGGTGGGGTTGGAGSTGQGGAGGGAPPATCATCGNANACCLAIPGATAADCDFSTADCNALSGTDQAYYIMGCQAAFTIGRLLPNPPAACL
jgi:hypothetical protein